MKIICNKTDLVNALNISLKAVPGKTTMPVLECFLIEAFDGSIKINTSNMELSIETIVNGRIDEEGKVAINAKLFSDIIRKLPDDYIIIEVDDNLVVYINCGKAKFKLAGLPGDDFPKMPFIVKNDQVNISQFTLKEIIRQTIFCVSDNENNKVMTGIHFEINENVLTVTSLDGHRIAIRNVILKGNYDKKDIIIPGKTLNEISKIIEGDAEKDVVMYFTDNSILFEVEDTVVLSRLIEGKYLNVKQMINYDYDTKITINKRELYDCIDRATLLVKEADRRPIIISTDEGSIKLNMNTSIGSLDEDIEVIKEGKDIVIGFNPKFIMDIIKVIDEEEITMYMTNAKAPCFIRDENITYNYLILPVSINQ